MDYKEKYKEALNKAQEELQCCGTLDCDVARQIFRFFPELKENGDERISREITEFLVDFNNGEYEIPNENTIDSWLSWLEKQNEQLKIKQDMLTTFRNSVPEEWDFSKDKDLKEEVDRCFHNGMFPEYITPNTTITVSDLMRCASHFYRFGKEHKPADKVEPKFKVGDWVVLYNRHQSIYQVETIENGYYILRHIHGGTVRICVLHDEDIRLWTIEDAKDGDVLYFDNLLVHGSGTLIYKADKSSHYIITKYCSVNEFGFEPNSYITLNDGYIIPASKEQRDLLFQKMHEAGYEWDSNTKQLIKNM